MTKGNVIDFNEFKYSRIALEFVNIRSKDPNAAAQFAKEKVKPEEFEILSKYIEAELSRQRGSEPLNEK